MSTLPPFNRSVRWSDYKIVTPAFELTPVEKPDMSPFLVHMTGLDEILDILNGKNSPSPLPPSHGYLRAAAPEYQGSSGAFNAPVVCFTETPTFALDFFRYRSFPRWRADQRYGVGFRKTPMVASGARPVVYFDDETTRRLVALFKTLSLMPPTTARESEAKALLDTVFPLVFPLLENLPSQGFMWEREWRITNPDGFAFAYEDIGIICCPEEEEPGIRAVLGSIADNIQFVRTWREYDTITDFLRRRQPARRAVENAVRSAETKEARTSATRNQVDQLKTSLHDLECYEGLATKFSSEQQRIAAERAALSDQLQAAERELETLTNPEEGKKDDMGLSS